MSWARFFLLHMILAAWTKRRPLCFEMNSPAAGHEGPQLLSLDVVANLIRRLTQSFSGEHWISISERKSSDMRVSYSAERPIFLKGVLTSSLSSSPETDFSSSCGGVEASSCVVVAVAAFFMGVTCVKVTSCWEASAASSVGLSWRYHRFAVLSL